ncbi:MAG: leucine-rich repeat domain-containing protein [Alphaproteobacteria bacterium]
MALNLLNDYDLNLFLTDVSFQGNPHPLKHGLRGEFESVEYVQANRDIIARCILNQYVKSRIRTYVLERGDEPAFIPVDATQPDLPDWTRAVFARGEKVYKFDGNRMSDDLRNDITMVRDYLFDVALSYVDKAAARAKDSKQKPTIRYDYLKTNNELQSFSDALTAAHAWHEKIAAGYQARLKGQELLEKSLIDVEFVMSLPDRMSVYKLTSSRALDFESDYMGLCVGAGGYDRGISDGSIEIYSIRDERGEPHVTLEVRNNALHQCKGKQNKRPIAKYLPAVQAFIKSRKFKLVGDTKNTGLLAQDGEYYDIMHLPHGFVIKGNLDLSAMDLAELPDMSSITIKGDFNCNNNQLTSLTGAPESVDGNFYCSNNQLTSLTGAPARVGGVFNCHKNQLTSLTGAPESVGIFDCSNNQLTSLTGAPARVGEVFNCSHNQLTSLTGAPESVGGNFNCSNNQLTSLTGVPESVGGNFYCHKNQLTSLTGAPESVGGDFYCDHNQLTSLTGAPESVGGDFYCHNNQLTSLTGAPESVGGNFACNRNQLTSLAGAPESVGGDFNCRNNQLTSLTGAPKSVGGDFNCSNNQLTSLTGAPESVGGDFNCRNNQLTSPWFKGIELVTAKAKSKKHNQSNVTLSNDGNEH